MSEPRVVFARDGRVLVAGVEVARYDERLMRCSAERLAAYRKTIKGLSLAAYARLKESGKC